MITEFAFKLNGISLEHMLQLDAQTINDAALNNFVYVYCQDDNTLALGGAINLKLPLVFHEGDIAAVVLYRYKNMIHAESDVKDIHEIEDKLKAEAFSMASDNGQLLLPENRPVQLPQAQWYIRASFPGSEFDIFTGNNLYCRGIVFSTEEIK